MPGKTASQRQREQLLLSKLAELRDFTTSKPDTKWIRDITYIPTDEDWLYAKDLCPKKVSATPSLTILTPTLPLPR